MQAIAPVDDARPSRVANRICAHHLVLGDLFGDCYREPGNITERHKSMVNVTQQSYCLLYRETHRPLQQLAEAYPRVVAGEEAGVAEVHGGPLHSSCINTSYPRAPRRDRWRMWPALQPPRNLLGTFTCSLGLLNSCPLGLF